MLSTFELADGTRLLRTSSGVWVYENTEVPCVGVVELTLDQVVVSDRFESADGKQWVLVDTAKAAQHEVLSRIARDAEGVAGGQLKAIPEDKFDPVKDEVVGLSVPELSDDARIRVAAEAEKRVRMLRWSLQQEELKRDLTHFRLHKEAGLTLEQIAVAVGSHRGRLSDRFRKRQFTVEDVASADRGGG